MKNTTLKEVSLYIDEENINNIFYSCIYPKVIPSLMIHFKTQYKLNCQWCVLKLNFSS